VQSDVVIVGYRLNAKEPAQKALERILGLSPDAARTLARSFPAVVVEGAANDNAERIRAQLSDAGALVELRASGGRPLAPAPRDLPAPPRSPARKPDLFALDLEPGTLPPTGPKTGTAPLAIPAPPRSTQPTRGGTPRAPQPTSRTARASLPQPPPPPLAAYQLGDFGLGPRGPGVGAKLPMGPPSLAPVSLAPPPAAFSPPTLADGDFDMDGSGMELDLGPGGKPLSLDPSPQPSIELDMLGERFEDLAPPRASLNGEAVRAARPAERMPEVEPAAFRAIQRGRVDSRRPVAKKRVSLLRQLLDGPLPSLLMLLVLSALSLGAVGYALNPDDPVQGLASAQALAESDAPDQVAHRDGYLHPLLRSTPRPVRAPLAAILRARIGGVHDLTVSFRAGDMDAQCTLVEHGADTEARLARVRETGHEVPATPAASLELIEHERSLRAQLGRPDLIFTRVCLVP
jgi:hypothetical protein